MEVRNIYNTAPYKINTYNIVPYKPNTCNTVPYKSNTYCLHNTNQTHQNITIKTQHSAGTSPYKPNIVHAHHHTNPKQCRHITTQTQHSVGTSPHKPKQCRHSSYSIPSQYKLIVQICYFSFQLLPIKCIEFLGIEDESCVTHR